jgi:hypothetical protein
MKIRDFITITALSSSVCATGGLFSAFHWNHLEETYEGLLNAIIPVKTFPGFEKNMQSDLIDLNKPFGFRRFLIVGPDSGVH